MCSLAIECVLLSYNVFSYYGMCSLTIECVLLLADTDAGARLFEPCRDRGGGVGRGGGWEWAWTELGLEFGVQEGAVWANCRPSGIIECVLLEGVVGCQNRN